MKCNIRKYDNNLRETICDNMIERMRLQREDPSELNYFENHLVKYKYCTGKLHILTDGINTDTVVGICHGSVIKKREKEVEVIKDDIKKENKDIMKFDDFIEYDKEINIIRSFYNNLFQKTLYLVGITGTGKTSLARALQFELIENNKDVEFVLNRDLKQIFLEAETFNRDYSEKEKSKNTLYKLINANMVILDDLGEGKKKPTEHFTTELFNLLEKMKGKLLITSNLPIISNLDFAKVPDKSIFVNNLFDARIVSRLLENIEILKFKSVDWRLKK